MRKLLGLVILVSIFYTACNIDLNDAEDRSSFTFSVSESPFSGEQIELKGILNQQECYNKPTVNLTILDSDNLSDASNNSVDASRSSINFAWNGNEQTGAFKAVFANDPTENIAGFINLVLINGDELIVSIPKFADVFVDRYEMEGGVIAGNMSFTGIIDWKVNGVLGHRVGFVNLGFSAIRGQDR